MQHDARVVLVVDDDPDVRDAAAAALAERGHDAVRVGGPPAAPPRAGRAPAAVPARAADEAPGTAGRLPRLDLLLTDIVMPGGLNGFELARRLKQMRPEIAVLYTTGYVDMAER